MESSHFHTNKDIDKLISDTEATVTTGINTLQLLNVVCLLYELYFTVRLSIVFTVYGFI